MPDAAPAIDLERPWLNPKQPRRDGRNPVSHLVWADNIARLIAAAPPLGFSPRSPEADDFVQVVHVCLVEVARRFDFSKVPLGGDPDGQFRGLAWRHFRTLVRRESERFRNGGAYSTTNNPAARAIRARPLPADRCVTCTDFLASLERPPTVRFEPRPGRHAPATECHRHDMLTAAPEPVEPYAGTADRAAWDDYGARLGTSASRLQWATGDWLVFGLAHFGDVYAAAEQLTGLKYQSLLDLKWVADRFDVSRRRETLSFSHHREVAALPPEIADAILARAADEGLSFADVRRVVREVRRVAADSHGPHLYDVADAFKFANRLSAVFEQFLGRDEFRVRRDSLLDLRDRIAAELRELETLDAGRTAGVA